MFGVVDGTNKRGRPCRELMDDIVSWCKTGLQELNSLAQDCRRWKLITRQAIDTNGHWSHVSWRRRRNSPLAHSVHCVWSLNVKPLISKQCQPVTSISANHLSSSDSTYPICRLLSQRLVGCQIRSDIDCQRLLLLEMLTCHCWHFSRMASALHEKFNFEEKLYIYCKETYQIFVQDEIKMVESVNKHWKVHFSTELQG